MVSYLSKFSILGLLLGSLLGCVSTASLQTAETVRSGMSRVTAGAGAQQSIQYNKVDSLILSDQDQAPVYPLDLRYDYGVTNEFQVTGIMGLPYGFGLGLKYRVCYSWVKCSFGLILRTGVQSIKGTDSTSDEDLEVEVRDITVPAYFSWRFSWFAPYVNLKYLNRSFQRDLNGSASMMAVDLGASLGHEWGVILEYSHALDLGSSFELKQTTLGYYHDLP